MTQAAGRRAAQDDAPGKVTFVGGVCNGGESFSLIAVYVKFLTIGVCHLLGRVGKEHIPFPPPHGKVDEQDGANRIRLRGEGQRGRCNNSSELVSCNSIIVV